MSFEVFVPFQKFWNTYVLLFGKYIEMIRFQISNLKRRLIITNLCQ